MAIYPEPREDLLRDATAMPERGQLEVAGEPAPVVVGYRRGGAVSIYLGDDPVLHFDAAGHLRRLFFDGQQFFAQDGRLVGYRRRGDSAGRVPRGGRVTAQATPLSPDQQTQLIAAVAPRLQRLLQATADGSARWTGSTVPADRLAARLASLAGATDAGIHVARRPNAS